MVQKNEVTIATGTLRGQTLIGGVAFRGIPYAAAPIGQLRYLPPQPQPGWQGVRDATKWGPRAPQAPAPDLQGFGFGQDRRDDPTWGGEPGTSEDCLVLNVTTPDPRPAGSLAPVMFWIHGGGYVSGSGADIGDGLNFARDHGIVFVSLNYRIGVFGFLNFGPLLRHQEWSERYKDAGNLGLLDQIAALQWVHENITAFGGDPNRVTLAGVSAGAKSVAALIASPLTDGLFCGAISESGGGDRALSPDTAIATATQLMRSLGLDSAESFLHLDADQLVDAAAMLMPGPGHDTWIWCPTIDGIILPQRPIDRISEGTSSRIPLLIGNNANESATYIRMDPAAAAPARANLLASLGSERATRIIAGYEALYPTLTSAEIDAVIMTDERYAIGTQCLADAQSRWAPTFRYIFEAAVPGLPLQMKAGHGTEAAFIFEIAPSTNGQAAELGRVMVNYWATFMQTGRPTCAEAPDWPSYNTSTRKTMIFDADPNSSVAEVSTDPTASRRELWAGANWPTSCTRS